MPRQFVDDFLPSVNKLVHVDFFVSCYCIYYVVQYPVNNKWRTRFQPFVGLYSGFRLFNTCFMLIIVLVDNSNISLQYYLIPVTSWV